MLRLKSKLAAGVVIVAFASACASTTVIKSTPPGAKVYIDGSLVGRTPFTLSDTKIVGSTTSVQLKLDGHEDFSGTITRSEQFEPGACLGGVLFLIPFLWIQGYKPEHNFELTPLRYAPMAYPGGQMYYAPPAPVAQPSDAAGAPQNRTAKAGPAASSNEGGRGPTAVPATAANQQVPPQHHQVPPQYQQVPPQYQQVPPQYQQVPPQYQQVPPQYQQVPPQYQQVPAQYQQVPAQYQQVPPQYQQVPPQYYQQVPPQYQQVPPQYQQVPPQPQPASAPSVECGDRISVRVGEGTEFRSAPDKAAPVRFKIESAEQGCAAEVVRGFRSVKLSQGRSGYVYEQAASPLR